MGLTHLYILTFIILPCDKLANEAKKNVAPTPITDSLSYSKLKAILQSAKILLLPPKYELIIVPSNQIGLFSIASC